jgi:hypothetical protein
MRVFTISADHNVTAYGSRTELPSQLEGELAVFASPEELASLAASWPGLRLVEIWNRLPGVRPVRRFTSRKTAVARIWQALSSVSAAAAPPPSGRKGRRRAGRRSRQRVARPHSKKAHILGLLERPEGATLTALMKATAWQAHTVRGFLSGTLRKRMGLKIRSFRTSDGDRAYVLEA